MSEYFLFFARYAKARSDLHKEVRRRLNNKMSEADYIKYTHVVVDLFEFFYSLYGGNINSSEKIKELAQRHNEVCLQLIETGGDGEHFTSIGLSKDVVRQSMFSEDNIRKLMESFRFSVQMDQIDIEKFMFKYYSKENIRKALVLFGEASLVDRRKVGKSTIIEMNGEAERIFESYLRTLMNE